MKINWAFYSSVCLLLPSNSIFAQVGALTWDPYGFAETNPTATSPTSGGYTGSLSGTWESVSWNTSQTGQSTLQGWAENSPAVFAVNANGNTPAFTITMNNNHTVAGMFDGLGTYPCAITVNGPGTLFLSGVQGIYTANDAPDDAQLTISNLVAGTGQIAVEGSGQIYLNGTNSYSGGTSLGFSGIPFNGIINFNNASSFGAGPITFTTEDHGGALVAEGIQAFTVSNAIVVAGTITNNFVGNSNGITWSGDWNLSSGTFTLETGSQAGNITIISGVVSGSAGLVACDNGILELENTMTYTGPTLVSNSCALALGLGGAIANSPVTVYSGATLANLSTGTVTIGGTTALNSGAEIMMTASGGAVGTIAITGNTTMNNTHVVINVVGSGLTPGTYPILVCSGMLNGMPNSLPTISGVPLASGQTASLSTTTGNNGSVNLIVNGSSATGNFALGTPSLAEGPSAGSDSVILAAPSPTESWSASANVTWLHLTAGGESGVGSTNVIYNFDSNAGPTRFGTLTVAGLTFEVTQGGPSYTPVPTVPVPLFTNGGTGGLGVDKFGNVYASDSVSNVIEEWVVATNGIKPLITTGLTSPEGIVLDQSGNIYIADSGDAAIKVWDASNGGLNTLLSSNSTTPLTSPTGVAVDTMGDIFIADDGENSIDEWVPSSQLFTNFVDYGPRPPFITPGYTGTSIGSAAVDLAGNLYYSQTTSHFTGDPLNPGTSSSTMSERSSATSLFSILFSSANRFGGATVDYAGNVYSGNLELVVASNLVIETPTPVGFVDLMGNRYFADDIVEETPRAFVDATPRFQSFAGGSGSLPPVLPTNEILLSPFSPASDQPWLTITGVTNGVVTFTFSTTTTNRTGHITLLGQSIPIVQAPLPLPSVIKSTALIGGGISLTFTNSNPAASFTILATTNLSLPVSSWTVLGTASNVGPSLFQFIDTQSTNSTKYYTIRSP